MTFFTPADGALRVELSSDVGHTRLVALRAFAPREPITLYCGVRADAACDVLAPFVRRVCGVYYDCTRNPHTHAEVDVLEAASDTYTYGVAAFARQAHNEQHNALNAVCLKSGDVFICASRAIAVGDEIIVLRSAATAAAAARRQSGVPKRVRFAPY